MDEAWAAPRELTWKRGWEATGRERASIRGTGSLDPAPRQEVLTSLPEPRARVLPEVQGTDRLIAAPRPSPVSLLDATLRLDAVRLFANWVMRAMNLARFRARPELRLAEVNDGMPELAVATLEALGASDPALDPKAGASMAQAAIALARRRAAPGFGLRDALAELREWSIEAVTAIWRAGADPPIPNGAPRTAVDRLVRLSAEATAAMAEDWVVRPAEEPA